MCQNQSTNCRKDGVSLVPRHRELPDTPLAIAYRATGKRLVDVAEETGINYKSLFAYIHGDRNPKRNTKKILADYFRTTVSSLFPEEGDHEPRSAA